MNGAAFMKYKNWVVAGDVLNEQSMPIKLQEPRGSRL